MKKFFIWYGWVFRKFSFLFVIFLSWLFVFGLLSFLSSLITLPAFVCVSANKITNVVVGILSVSLSAFLFYKAIFWIEEKNNWKVALYEGKKCAKRRGLKEDPLFLSAKEKTKEHQNPFYILKWMKMVKCIG